MTSMTDRSQAGMRRLKTYSCSDIPKRQLVRDLARLVAEHHALVFVDRPGASNGPEEGIERSVDLQAMEGVELCLVGEVQELSDTVAHGVYDGRLGELSVIVDQYVDLRNGVPLVLRVITHAEGMKPVKCVDRTAYALSLLRRLSPAPRVAIKPARLTQAPDGPSAGSCCCCA